MASVPLDGSVDPGLSQAAQADPNVVQNAVSQGHSWDDITSYASQNGQPAPAQPDLSAVWYGNYAPAPTDTSTGEPDAINEGAGPIGEAVMAGAAGVAAGAIAGAGAVAGDAVATDVAQSSRAAAMGVTTDTANAAVGKVNVPLSDDISTAGKVFRKVTAAGTGYNVLEGGLGEGYLKKNKGAQ